VVIIGHAGHAQNGATNVAKVKQSSRRGARSQMDNGQKDFQGYTSALPAHKSMEDGEAQGNGSSPKKKPKEENSWQEDRCGHVSGIQNESTKGLGIQDLGLLACHMRRLPFDVFSGA